MLYRRRKDALTESPPLLSRPGAPPPVEAMLLALTTPSGIRSALPPLARALPQAELLHRALVRLCARDSAPCPELTGKNSARRPLTGHKHASLLPVDLDGDGRIDHILIHAPMGLGPVAQRAVRSLRRTFTKGGVGELQAALAGRGDLQDLRSLPSPLRQGIEALLGPQGGARKWTSFTPLVLPRHCKPRGTNSVEGQVIAELASRGFLGTGGDARNRVAVEVLPWDEHTRKLRHAVRVRRHPAQPPPVDAGLALRLVFDTPVHGPMALGYASHFGLGVFVAHPD